MEVRVGVVAFSTGEKEEPCDKLCAASFLGNFYDLGPSGFKMAVSAQAGWFGCLAFCQEEQHFRNAEAAFHSLKFWQKRRAIVFENLTGAQAVTMSEQLAGYEDPKLAGLATPFRAMLHVLRAKFRRDSELAALLSKTDSDFLLHHVSSKGADPVWSDDFDGTGANWLGMQLMLIRDELAIRLAGSSPSRALHAASRQWTPFIERCIDIQTGAPASSQGARLWRDAIENAASAIRQAVSPKVAPPALPIPILTHLLGCKGCKQVGEEKCAVQ